MKELSAINLFAASSLLALTSAANAQSETGDNGASSALEEVIVTARRMEESVQDVPISMTVLNQQQLADRNIVNSSDLANYTPSLSVNDNFGSANTAFSIRGFVQEIGTQPSVGVYFADVVAPRGAANNTPIGDGAGPGNFFDLQNVQVLNGPQGTLFGRNTTGGAVLLVPNKPTRELGGYIEGSAGNLDMKRIQAVLNVPLNDAVRMRFGVDHQARDGYLENTTGVGPSRIGDVKYTAARASLVVDLNPNLENYTVVSYLNSDTIGDLQKVIACDPAGNFGFFACGQLAREQAKGSDFFTVQNIMPSPQTELKQWQMINTTTWRATDSLTIKNIASYAELKQFLKNQLFGTDFQVIGPETSFYFAVSNSIPGHNTADQYTATDEFQIQGNQLDGRLIWQGGVYGELSRPLGLSGNFTPGFLHCTDAANLICTDPLGFGSFNYTAGKNYFQNIGAYAQGTFALTDQLKLTGGYRYTWDKASSNAVLANYAADGTTLRFCNEPTAPFPACDVRYQVDSSAPTWLIGLDYNPLDDVLLYAKYARGYRAGGLSPQAPAQFAVFNQEQVDTYEIGSKTTFTGALRGTLSVAAFYNDFRDQQLQLQLLPKPGSLVAPASAVLNAGASTIYGAELDASFVLFTGFTLDMGYAYLNTKLDAITPIVTPATSPYNVVAAMQVGDELVHSPKNKYTVTATYVLPLSKDIGQISLGVTLAHTDKQLSNYNKNTSVPEAAELGSLDSRDILNLNLNWKAIAGSPIDLAIFATNLTNEEYYGHIPGLYSFLGFETATIGMSRTYGARLRYSFSK